MSAYEGSFNGFTFGDGGGAAVSSITGWWGNSAKVDVAEGAEWSLASVQRSSGAPRLGLTLKAATVEAFDTLREQALAAFVPSRDPMELVVDGWSKWVHVVDVAPNMDPSWPGPETNCPMPVNFVAPDDTRYTSVQATAVSVATGSPASSANGQAANSGLLVEHARRAFEFRFTAHGATTSPRVRVDHADGSWEQITLQGLAMTSGQVLTYKAGEWRVGSQPVSGYVRSASNLGSGRAPRLWRLLPSTGSDSVNTVTMSVATGQFSGFAKVRGTR